MTNANIGTVTGTSFYDMRFLNPFEKLPNGGYFGERYGYIQFIYIVCALISLISVIYYSSNKSKLPLQLLLLFISYFVMYYNLSCLLIPNDHERCYLVVWMFLLSVIVSTVLTIFGESLFKNINKFINKKTGGAHCYKKDEDDEQTGGAHCYKKDEDDEQTGGAHCYKKDEDDEQTGGGYGHKKDEDMYGAGGWGYEKNKEMYGGDNNHKHKKKYKKYKKFKNKGYVDYDEYKKKNKNKKIGGKHCYKNNDEQNGGYFKY